MTMTINMPTRQHPTPGHLLRISLVRMIILTGALQSTHGVNIVRHPTTSNCEDPRERCNQMAPYSCCYFPDLGARSIEFQNVYPPMLLATWVPDIRSVDMCKYLIDKRQVQPDSAMRLCMSGTDLTGGSWRPSPPSDTTGGENVNEDLESSSFENPYPGLMCKFFVKATQPTDDMDNEDSGPMAFF